jgi:acyl carrier protein
MGLPDRPSKDDVLREIQQWMKELFELDSDRVQPDARLIEDLDLDSLDAFDLAVKVEEVTGIAFDENQIRELRTVEDVLTAIHGTLGGQGAASLRPAAARSDS